MAVTDLSLISPGMRLVRPPDPPGQLRTLVTVLDGKVILDFGQAIRWVGFTPDEAQKLVDELLGAVRSARTLHVR